AGFEGRLGCSNAGRNEAHGRQDDSGERGQPERQQSMLTQNLPPGRDPPFRDDGTACRPCFHVRRPDRPLVRSPFRAPRATFPLVLTETLQLDPSDPAFLADPYPVLSRLRESAPVFYDDGRERWFVTRHEDVRGCLRDKRLGRNFRRVMSPEEIGVPPLDPRWQAFWE